MHTVRDDNDCEDGGGDVMVMVVAVVVGCVYVTSSRELPEPGEGLV